MCKLKFLKMERKFYEGLYSKLFFCSKNKNSTLLIYYKRKITKLDKKINSLEKLVGKGDVIYFKDDNYQPYFT